MTKKLAQQAMLEGIAVTHPSFEMYKWVSTSAVDYPANVVTDTGELINWDKYWAARTHSRYDNDWTINEHFNRTK